MAFMMPVVKKDWEIYPNKPVRSRKSSTCSNPTRTSVKSAPDALGTSPKSLNEFGPQPARRRYQRSESQDSTDSGNTVPAPATLPKSASSSSFTNFHTKLVEKIRRIRTKSKEETDSDIIDTVGRNSS